MVTNSVVTLRILDRADKDVLELSRTDKGAVWEFVSKFRQNPHQPGLHFKQLQSDSRSTRRVSVRTTERCCCAPTIATIC